MEVESFLHMDPDDESHYHSFRPFGWNVWSSYYYDGFGWVRVFGRGIKWKDTETHMLIFSERHGFRKVLNIGKWRIGVLKKD